MKFQLKSLSFLSLFVALFLFYSCDQENINDIEIEEEQTSPVTTENIAFITVLNGLDTFFHQSVELADAASVCLQGTFSEYGVFNNYDHSYAIGNGDDLQIHWFSNAEDPFAPHTIDATPTGEYADMSGFTTSLYNRCDFIASDYTELNSYGHGSYLDFMLTLDEIGEIGDLMSGTYEGKLWLSYDNPEDPDNPIFHNLDEATVTFSVPRVELVP